MKPIRIVLVGLLLLISESAYCHLVGMTDTRVQVGHTKLKLVYTLPTASLQQLGLNPADSDAVKAKISQAFLITNNQVACPMTDYRQHGLPQIQAQQFVLIMDCKTAIDALDIRYRLLEAFDASHKNYSQVLVAGRTQNVVFSHQNTTDHLPVGYLLKLWHRQLSDDFVQADTGGFSLSQVTPYFSLGVKHILTGFDHLLFLLGLLLLPLSLRQLLALVTTFTVAHSITLAVSVLGVVSAPSRWVESCIALSIVYVALENVWELRHANSAATFLSPWKRRLVVTFLFGLIHGFGFSYVLKEIGLGGESAGALLMFNLGVEAGQMIMVLTVFPLLYLAFHRWRYLQFARVASLMVGVMGSYWLVERLMSA